VLDEAKYPFTVGVGIVTQQALHCGFKTTTATSPDFDQFGDPVVALTPDTSGTEPSVDFISSTAQSGGQWTLGMS
jgi:hypothetical protein